MGIYLATPSTEINSEVGQGAGVEFAVGEMQGWRKHMEDAHIAIPGIVGESEDNKVSLFGVFDGHGGKEVAKFVKIKFPDVLLQLDSFRRGDFEKTLKESFHSIDNLLEDDRNDALLKELRALPNPSDMRSRKPAAETRQSVSEGSNLVASPSNALVPIKVPDDNTSEDTKAEENTDDLSPKSKDSNDSDASDNSDNSENSETGGSPDNTSKSKKANGNEPISSDEAIRMISELLEGARKYRSAKSGAVAGAKSDSPDTAADSKDQPSAEEVDSQAENKLDTSSSSSKKKQTITSDSDSKKEGVVNVGTTPSSFMDDEDEEGNFADVESSGSVGKAVGAESKLTSDFKEQVSLLPAAGRGDSKKEMMEKKMAVEDDLSSTSGSAPATSTNSNDSADSKDSAAVAPIVRDPSKKDLDTNTSSGDSDNKSTNTMGTNEEGLSPPKLADAKSVPVTTKPPAPAAIMSANGTMMCNLKDHRVLAGCTAIVALLVGNKKLYVANAGDSRAVMMRNGLAVALSEDHKPQQERELNRIRAAGGYVNMVGRVNGNLNLSRSLGDLKYKQLKHLQPEEQIITAEPDITAFDIRSGDEFIILACDGIWDCLTNQEACDMVKEGLNKGQTLEEITKDVLKHCLADDPRRSQGIGGDNMTFLVVQFKQHK